MPREIIHTDQAPAALGTYSQAVKIDGLVFLSGQIPLVPSTGELVEGDFKAQVHQVFKNLTAVAGAAGGGLNDSVKLTIFLTDLGKFAIVNEIMAQYFDQPYPARSTIEVSGLPKAVEIEIDAILKL